MNRRSVALPLATALALAALAACSKDERQAIVVQKDRISVFNLTDAAWTDVDVWLNDHYRVQAAGLVPGQRLDIPIGVFIAGYGQRFDNRRQAPFGVEVDARRADGRPVRITWGRGRRGRQP
jgi:hypothetical protein